MGFDPKTAPKVEFWRDIRKGALTDGEPCPRDIDIFVNKGTVLGNRLRALRRMRLKQSFLPLVGAGAVVAASAVAFVLSFKGIELLPSSPASAAESKWPGVTSSALSKAYGAGLAGRYELTAISKVIPGWNAQGGISASNVDRVLGAPAETQTQLADECRAVINSGGMCSVAGLIAYRHGINGEPPSSISAGPKDQLAYFNKLYLQAPGKCDNYKANGFYTKQKGSDETSSFADVVFASALDSKAAVEQVTAVQKSWAADSFPKAAGDVVEVKSLKELLGHRRADSCEPISVAVFRFNGSTLEYLVSVISRNGSTVSSSLFGLAGSKGYHVTRLLSCRECDMQVSNAVPTINLSLVPDTSEELAKALSKSGYQVEGM